MTLCNFKASSVTGPWVAQFIEMLGNKNCQGRSQGELGGTRRGHVNHSGTTPTVDRGWGKSPNRAPILLLHSIGPNYMLNYFNIMERSISTPGSLKSYRSVKHTKHDSPSTTSEVLSCQHYFQMLNAMINSNNTLAKQVQALNNKINFLITLLDLYFSSIIRNASYCAPIPTCVPIREHDEGTPQQPKLNR